MRVRVDSRVGSKHLYDPLRQSFKIDRKVPAEVELTQLPFGDIAWDGNGEDDVSIPIAVELVKIPDLLAKIETRRFTDHQLPGLLGHYKVVYLVVEGRWLVKADGTLDVFAGEIGRHGFKGKQWRSSGFLYRAVNGFLLSMQAFPKVIVVRTNDTTETVQWLHSTIAYWAKPWSEHSSFQAWAGVTLCGSTLTMRQPPLVEKVAAQLPSIGQEKAGIVAAKFGSVKGLVNATPEQWVGIRSGKNGGKSKKTGKALPSISMKQALEIQRALEEKNG